MFHWFHKEVRCVTIRNLAPIGGDNLDNLPSPVLEIMPEGESSSDEELKILTSAVVSESCNPNWFTSNFIGNGTGQEEECGKAIFRVKNSSDGNVLLETAVDFESMKYLGAGVDLTNFQKMPFNTILFVTDVGFYVQTETYASLGRLAIEPLVDNETDNASSDSENDGEYASRKYSSGGSSQLKEEENVFAEALAKIRADVTREMEGGDNGISKDQQALERKYKALQIAQLRVELEMAERAADEEEKAEQEDLSVLRDTNDLQKHTDCCNAIASKIILLREEQEGLRKEGAKVQFLLEARLVKLLSELQTIYPIEPVPHTEGSCLNMSDRGFVKGLYLYITSIVFSNV